MFILDLKSRTPIYEQLKNKTLEMIIAGVIQQDSQLPSVRALAKELGVNPNTIQKAYQDMEREGIIYSVAGRGSFVSDIKSVKEKQRDVELKNLEEICIKLKNNKVSKQDVLSKVEKVYSEEGIV